MRVMQRVAFFIIKTISVFLTSCLIVVCLFFGYIFYCNFVNMDVPTLGPFRIYIVISDSMAPYLRVNDAVIVRKTDPVDLRINDVITFYSFESDIVITHRIIGGAYLDGDYVFSTKGDNNNVADNFTTLGSRIIGKVVFPIPQLAAYMDVAVQRPYAIAVVVGVVVVIQLALGGIERLLRPSKKDGEKAVSLTAESKDAATKVIANSDISNGINENVVEEQEN